MASTRTRRRDSGQTGEGMLSAAAAELPGMQDELRSLAHDATLHGRRLVDMARGVAVTSGTRAAEIARQRASVAAERARSGIADRPLTAVLIAAGIGAVLAGGALLLTGSRRR